MNFKNCFEYLCPIDAYNLLLRYKVPVPHQLPEWLHRKVFIILRNSYSSLTNLLC